MNRYKSHTVSIIGVKEILLLIFALLSAFPALKATGNFEKNICFPAPEYLSRIGCDSSATDSIILKCINELNSDSIGRYIQLPWLGIAAIQFYLLRKDFDKTFFEIVASVFRRSKPH